MLRQFKLHRRTRAQRLTFIALCASTVIATRVHAQDPPIEAPRRARPSLLFGSSAHTLTNATGSAFPEGYTQKYVLNMNAGILLQVPIGKAWSVQPEFHYGVFGSQFDSPAGVDKTSLKIKFEYLEIPVLLRRDFGGRFNRFQQFAVAGASVAKRIHCTREFTTVTVQDLRQGCDAFNGDTDPDNDNPFTSTDAFAIAGAGIQMNTNGGAAYSLQLRFAQGLLSTTLSGKYSGGKPLNRALMLLVGISM